MTVTGSCVTISTGTDIRQTVFDPTLEVEKRTKLYRHLSQRIDSGSPGEIQLNAIFSGGTNVAWRQSALVVIGDLNLKRHFLSVLQNRGTGYGTLTELLQHSFLDVGYRRSLWDLGSGLQTILLDLKIGAAFWCFTCHMNREYQV